MPFGRLVPATSSAYRLFPLGRSPRNFFLRAFHLVVYFSFFLCPAPGRGLRNQGLVLTGPASQPRSPWLPPRSLKNKGEPKIQPRTSRKGGSQALEPKWLEPKWLELKWLRARRQGMWRTLFPAAAPARSSSPKETAATLCAPSGRAATRRTAGAPSSFLRG